MLDRARFVLSALAALSALVPAVSHAHSRLLDPVPITNDDGLKSGPCGCYFGDTPEDATEEPNPMKCNNVYPIETYEPGQTITVLFEETINHTGSFRVAFSPKAPEQVTKADFEAGVLSDEPDANAMSGGDITATITLPDVECDPCVVQLRQLMDGAATPYYYSCAAVRLVAPGGGGAGGMGGAGGAGGAGAEGGAGGDAGTGGSSGSGPPPGGDTDVNTSTGAGPAAQPVLQRSGCSISGSAGGDALVAVGVGVVAFVAAERRRSRGKQARR
jgi:hypothetical protein